MIEKLESTSVIVPFQQEREIPPSPIEMMKKINILIDVVNFILERHPKIRDEIEQYEYDRIFNS